MKKYKVKYGFFSTYNRTIFLKQEWRGEDWVLWHSRPIKNLTRSTGVNQNLTDLVDHVSVRECFLYLQTQMYSGDWYADNKGGKWHLNQMSGSFPMRYYDNDDPNTPMRNCDTLMPGVPEQQGESRRSDRNRQTSAVEGGKALAPSPSSQKLRDQQTIRGSGYDGGNSTKRTDKHREQGKKLQPSEQNQRAHSVQHARPSTNTSRDKSESPRRPSSSNVRISSSPANTSPAQKELPLLRANERKETVPPTFDSVRPKTLDRDGVLKPRSEARAQQHRAGQPPVAQHRGKVADSERHRRGP